MKPIVCALLLLVSTVIRVRLSPQLEIVALRHQHTVYQRSNRSNHAVIDLRRRYRISWERGRTWSSTRAA